MSFTLNSWTTFDRLILSRFLQKRGRSYREIPFLNFNGTSEGSTLTRRKVWSMSWKPVPDSRRDREPVESRESCQKDVGVCKWLFNTKFGAESMMWLLSFYCFRETRLLDLWTYYIICYVIHDFIFTHVLR